MTVYAITDTKKGRTGIVPTYLQSTRSLSGSGRSPAAKRFLVNCRLKIAPVMARKTTSGAE